jgi:hypothetical protein
MQSHSAVENSRLSFEHNRYALDVVEKFAIFLGNYGKFSTASRLATRCGDGLEQT